MDLFGAKIEPACVYCANGTESADGQMIFCEKRGAVAPYYSCRRVEYDPLLRKPKPPAVLPEYDPEEFQL